MDGNNAHFTFNRMALRRAALYICKSRTKNINARIMKNRFALMNEFNCIICTFLWFRCKCNATSMVSKRESVHGCRCCTVDVSQTESEYDPSRLFAII